MFYSFLKYHQKWKCSIYMHTNTWTFRTYKNYQIRDSNVTRSAFPHIFLKLSSRHNFFRSFFFVENYTLYVQPSPTIKLTCDIAKNIFISLWVTALDAFFSLKNNQKMCHYSSFSAYSEKLGKLMKSFLPFKNRRKDKTLDTYVFKKVYLYFHEI